MNDANKKILRLKKESDVGSEFGTWMVGRLVEGSPGETTGCQPKLPTVISATIFLAGFAVLTSGPFFSIDIPACHPP